MHNRFAGMSHAFPIHVPNISESLYKFTRRGFNVEVSTVGLINERWTVKSSFFSAARRVRKSISDDSPRLFFCAPLLGRLVTSMNVENAIPMPINTVKVPLMIFLEYRITKDSY